MPSDPTAELPWPLPGRRALRDRLVEAYGVGRGYHDLLHLSEVLARIAELGGATDDALLLAAWFHDAVYAGRPDDEERSAQLAEAELAGWPDAVEVARLVRLTATHDPEPEDHRGAVLCDADLAILAASPARYAAYVAGVRQDFAAVTDEAFRAGRLLVLEELAGRRELFRTHHARTHWDAAARRNLEAEIRSLRG
ncbi:MAG: HD domain-containing protein [Marmoricola sp.]